MQRLNICVKQIFSAIQRKIAGKVYYQETAEAQTRDRHHQFFSNGCFKYVYEPVHFSSGVIIYLSVTKKNSPPCSHATNRLRG